MWQGKSAGESCPIWILKSLLDKEKMGFEELVELGKAEFSRGTINKYLGIEYNRGNIHREGRRGKYFLSEKGKKWLLENINSELKKILDTLSETIHHLKNTSKVKESFRNDLSKISTEDFEHAKNNAMIMFKPFTDLLKSIIVLQLWLQPNFHPLSGISPWMQILKPSQPQPEISQKEAEQIVEHNFFLFGTNMEGFIPIPPLPPEDKQTVAYYQNAWKFVKSIKPKNRPLPPRPFKRSSLDNAKIKNEKNTNQSSSKAGKKNDKKI